MHESDFYLYLPSRSMLKLTATMTFDQKKLSRNQKFVDLSHISRAESSFKYRIAMSCHCHTSMPLTSQQLVNSQQRSTISCFMKILVSALLFQFTENRSAPHMDVSSFRIHVRLILTCSIILAAAASTTASGGAKRTSTAVLIVVDQSGHGDYSKIQDAIDSVPSKNSELVFISVKPGTYRSVGFLVRQSYYDVFLKNFLGQGFVSEGLLKLFCFFPGCREKVVVPVDKPFITVSGEDASNTVITWGDGGDIIHSPTLTVLASDFIGRYLTIQVM